MPFSPIAIRTEEVRSFNPDTGAVITRTHEGTEAQITEIENYWATANIIDGTATGRGYKTVKTKTPRGYKIVVTIPDDQLYTDRWSLTSEVRHIPIWYGEGIREYLGFSTPTGTAAEQLTQNLQYYRARSILTQLLALYQGGNSAETSAAFTTSETNLINAFLALGVDWGSYSEHYYNIIFQIIRETDSIEFKRPVLTRNRTLPVGSTNQAPLVGSPLVYTTAALIADTSIAMPAEVIARITNVEVGIQTAPPNTRWGWKLRQDNAEMMIGFGKYIECKDWVFDRWSTITNTFAT